MNKTDLETLDRYFAITGRREKDAALAAALAQISTLQASLAAAEGERDRYKAALTEIVNSGHVGSSGAGRFIARAALSPPPAGQGT